MFVSDLTQGAGPGKIWHVTCKPVGGTTELLVDDSAARAESADSFSNSTLPIAAAAGGVLIALAGGGLYIRRRLVR